MGSDSLTDRAKEEGNVMNGYWGVYSTSRRILNLYRRLADYCNRKRPSIPDLGRFPNRPSH